MQFYNKIHPFYCGIDLHVKSLYVCIINDKGEKILHKSIKASPDELLELLMPYIGKVVIGAECMHCWYWVADLCRNNNIEFILGHALYMKSIHGGKAKNDKIDSFKIVTLMRGGTFPLAYVYPEVMRATRDLLRRRSNCVYYRAQLKAHVKNTASQYNLTHPPVNLRSEQDRILIRDSFNQLDESVQVNIGLDLNLVKRMDQELYQIESFIEKQAKQHNPCDYDLLRTIPGVGKIIALTIIYEVGHIERFSSVQRFASYSLLIKCKAESAGKSYGTRGNKKGNIHLKRVFSQMTALYLSNSPQAKQYLQSLQKRMSKPKALAVLSHKIGRCVYKILKDKSTFNEALLLK